MATALFISRTDLVRNSILDGNVDTDKFIQFIKLGQIGRASCRERGQIAVVAVTLKKKNEKVVA